jgi:rhodanese-related sulfurtransferase
MEGSNNVGQTFPSAKLKESAMADRNVCPTGWTATSLADTLPPAANAFSKTDMGETTMNGNGEELPLEIDVRAVQAMRAGGENFVLLDVREQDEFNLVHIEGARLVPMSQIQARLEELMPLREKPIVVHCHHGGRSERVTHWLRANGFQHVQNMAGGIDAWAVEVDPALPRY